jgi:FkbM family methyltransferase
MNEPPSPKYTVLLPSRWGWFLGMKSDPFQTGSVATMGEWSPDESNLILGFLRPGDTVLDVGANVGNLTLAFAAAVGQRGSVLAFEPQRLVFLCLCANVALNSLGHYVNPCNLAIGETAGSIDVPNLNPLQEIINFGGVSLLDQHTTPTTPVPMITIDSMGLESVRLIKCDIEGMEPAALRGARETITRCQPVIWTECLADRHTRPALIEFFASVNYRAWLVCTDIYSPRNVKLCRHNMFTVKGDDGTPGTMQDHNVLAIPAAVEPPLWVSQCQTL